MEKMTTQPNANTPLIPRSSGICSKSHPEIASGAIWKSLADTQEYRAFLENEFPHDPAKELAGTPRRDVLKWMAASAALAGTYRLHETTGTKNCSLRAPAGRNYSREAALLCHVHDEGRHRHRLVGGKPHGASHQVEGNPQHPASLGSTDIFAQASVLGLYDPDRSKTVIREGRISSWGAFLWSDRRLAHESCGE